MSQRLALFDIDGTLVPHPSTERRFAAWLARAGVAGWRQWLGFGWFALRYLPRYRGTVLQKNKAWLAGLDLDRVSRQARVFVQEELRRALDPAVTARLRAHQRAGDAVVLLSGTPDFLAAPLGELLGVPEVVATRCAVRDGRLIGAPPLLHPHGSTKLRLARELAAAGGQTLRDCVAYADSAHDIPLLQAVDQAVVVRPGRRLHRQALAAGWEILPGAGSDRGAGGNTGEGRPATPSGTL